MPNKTRLAKRSEKGLLTPDNCVVTIIDLQPQMLFGVGNFDRQSIINNNEILGKAARVFDVPVVLSPRELYEGDHFVDAELLWKCPSIGQAGTVHGQSIQRRDRDRDHVRHVDAQGVGV